MAAITITPANVQQSAAAIILHGIAGAAITAGQPLYRDSSDNTYKLADCDAENAALADVVGIALNGAAEGQPVSLVTGDAGLVIGGTVVKGTVYCLGDTAGQIVPLGDLGDGDRVVVLGMASSTTVLNFKIWKTGITLSA